jgi:hypothetical protein
MHDSYQATAWDHTCWMIAAWSTQINPDSINPFRRKRKSQKSGMQPVELYALAQALRARNSKT